MSDKEKPEASGAHFVAFDELNNQDTTPLKIYLGDEAWSKLMDALNEPPKPNEALKRLLKDGK